MKILYALHGYKPAYKLGGPIQAVSAVAERLVRKGNEVIVFASNSNLDEDLDVPTDQCVDVNGVQAWYFKHEEPIQRWLPFMPYLSNSIGFLYAPAMRAALDWIVPSVDLVHILNPFIYPTYAAGKAAIRHRKPLFYQQSGALGSQHLKRRGLKKKLYIKAIERPLMERAVSLIALTEAEVDSYAALGVHTPCRIIPNGVEVVSYPESQGTSFGSLDILRHEIVILFMARLHPMKGAHRLIRAFLRIHSRFPAAKLVMAGPDDSATVEEFRAEIEKAGVSERILFPGMVTGELKQQLLTRADLFCLPSDAEGFSVAVLEAMAHKTAVLISPDCHFPAVEWANAGKVISVSVSDLAQALSSLLVNRAKLREMGKNGYDLVKEQYDWDRIVESLITVYAEGISRNNRRS